MRLIAFMFVAAGTGLTAWGLYVFLFQVQAYAVSDGGPFQVALALHALAKPLLLVISGAGAMLGAVAASALAGKRQA
ncbi:hypothetical protein [Nonomuraea sp. SYSU D8015]|uniref:hypothetical protein n=1 Tax=Nonomuraea sp. SYSU D8015 TaxID=2593644 RepID=UPI001660C36B|nr:hypothetical protein [Nonomuraea sp. SYSU D8015]